MLLFSVACISPNRQVNQTHLARSLVWFRFGIWYWHWCRSRSAILPVRTVNHSGSAGQWILQLWRCFRKWGSVFHLQCHACRVSIQQTIREEGCRCTCCGGAEVCLGGLGTGNVKSPASVWSVIGSSLQCLLANACTHSYAHATLKGLELAEESRALFHSLVRSDQIRSGQQRLLEKLNSPVYTYSSVRDFWQVLQYMHKCAQVLPKASSPTSLYSILALTMAQALVTKALQENLVMVFSKTYCPHCLRAKRTLDAELGHGKYAVMELESRPDCSAIQDYLNALTGARTVPRVFLEGVPLYNFSGPKSCCVHTLRRAVTSLV